MERYKVGSEVERVEVEMPDGQIVTFYKLRTMPLCVAREYFRLENGQDDILLAQLCILAPEADEEYLSRVLSQVEAGKLLTFLAEGVPAEEKKEETPGPTTQSPDSAPQA